MSDDADDDGEQHAFARTLAEAAGGAAVAAMTRLAGGEESLAYRCVGPSVDLVVRLSPRWRTRAELAWSHDVVRLARTRVSEAIAPMAIDGQTLFDGPGGRSAAVYKHVKGEPLDVAAPSLADDAMRVLAALHHALLDWHGPPRPPHSPTTPLHKRLDPDGLAALADLDVPVMHDRTLDAAAGAVGGRGASCLTQGDYWSANILCAGNRVVGVIDWEDAREVPCLSEAAWAAWNLSGGDAHRFRRLLERYCDAGGAVDVTALDDAPSCSGTDSAPRPPHHRHRLPRRPSVLHRPGPPAPDAARLRNNADRRRSGTDGQARDSANGPRTAGRRPDVTHVRDVWFCGGRDYGPRDMRRLLKSVFVVLALVAAAVGVQRLRRQGSSIATFQPTTRTARGAEMARLGARVGGTVATNRARRLFASAERKEELDTELELRTAEDVAATLGNMKGALMKLGQLASFVDDGMPEPVRQALEQLQADAPPMSAALAAEIVESELGSPPDRAFAEWDPVPIAAASIGQVHRAMTHDGVAVAVKVQYPGVEDAIRADLDSFDMAMFGAPVLYKDFEPKPFIDEIRERIGEELDYVNEAANQRLFADWYRGHPFIHVPDVVDELSGRRVLTTELASGARFAELTEWDQHERNLAGETIFRFVFRSLYRLKAFNGDPHPGNYLFGPGGHVTFLDFGLVKHYSDDHISQLMDMADAMILSPSPEKVLSSSVRAGYYRADAPVTAEEIREFSMAFWEMVSVDAPFRFTPEYATEVNRRFFLGRATHGKAVKYANMPARWTILQRINVGLIAILGRLEAEANWRQIAEEMWPLTDRAPSTPLGRDEAAWWSAHPIHLAS